MTPPSAADPPGSTPDTGPTRRTELPPPVGPSATELVAGCGLAATGLAAVVLSAVTIGILHIIPPSDRLDPMSRTISEYALLSNGWVFDAGVLVLATGTLAVLAALILLRLVRFRSAAAAMIALGCAGLVGLVAFPKHGFGADSTFEGRVHWTWTLIALFSLPIGITLACRRLAGQGRWPRLAVRLCAVAAGWFAVLTIQSVLSATTSIGSSLWVGLVERALSLTEMVAVGVLAAAVLAYARRLRAAPVALLELAG